ncbi:AaceriAAR137Wp [[Ashbya] aceris (nom. inval.)]|nr:AaceriAAR137Wp [[Ashbya] aceris (nom. inval.)]
MQQLININERPDPRMETGLSSPSPDPLRSFQTVHNNSSARDTARTPSTEVISDSLEKVSSDLLKLTPVNIGCFSSPSKEMGEQAGGAGSAAGGCAMHPTLYRENFNLISRQLENLLNNLNVVYREIGYSNTEISAREKMIFNKLSSSISSFFYQADGEKAKLSRENEICQEVLRRLLEVIDDPKGVRTIPDLYTRNSIMGMESQSPNKKPISLLNRKRVLTTAKLFVIKKSTPQLLCFLESSMKLRRLIDSMSDYTPPDEKALIKKVPPIDTCKFFKNYFTEHIDDVDLNYQFLLDNRDVLLQSVNFTDVTETMVSNIMEVAKLYQKELSSRLGKAKRICHGLLKLLQTLGMNIMDLGDEVKDKIRIYTQKGEETICDLSHSTLSMLEDVVAEYEGIKSKRAYEKENLVKRCECLWEKLKISPCYIDKFKQENDSLTVQHLNNFVKELERLESMKKKLIRSLIEDSWARIKELWNLMHFNDNDRTEFTILYENMVSTSSSLEENEKVLDLCEKQIRALEKKYAIVKPMLELVDEFKVLHKERLELEESSKDSSRLLSRNSHKILLQEEKARKRVTRHFPSVIYQLKMKLVQYVEEFREDFLVDGRPFLEIVNEEQEQLHSKYPRMRFTSGARKPLLRSKSLPIRYSIQKKTKLVRGANSSLSKSFAEKTPLRSTENVNVIRPKPDGSTQAPNSKIVNFPSLPRTIQGTQVVSPQKKAEKAYSASLLDKSSPTKIPALTRASSHIILRSPEHNHEDHGPSAKYTQLSALSTHKLNKRTLIPILSTHINTFPLNQEDKENNCTLESPAIITKKYRQQLLSSPIKGNGQPIYGTTEGEDTKASSTIEDIKVNSMAGDESSMMEDKNFTEWKRLQLAKLNESSIRSGNELTTRINWEHDVF